MISSKRKLPQENKVTKNLGLFLIALKIAGFLFFFLSGFLVGFSYVRFTQREECLKMNFSQNPDPMTSDEIEELNRILNENQGNFNSNKETGAPKELPASPELNSNDNSPQSKKYVGSRNSNKFYLPTCRFSKRIKEENKVWFESVEAGEKAGREYIECE